MAAFAMLPNLQGCTWVPGTEEARANTILAEQPRKEFSPKTIREIGSDRGRRL